MIKQESCQHVFAPAPRGYVRNPIAQRGGVGTPELTQTSRDTCGAQWANGQQALGNGCFGRYDYDPEIFERPKSIRQSRLSTYPIEFARSRARTMVEWPTW
jgi:hypothetical protein